MKEYSPAETNAILNAHTDLNDALQYFKSLNNNELQDKIGALWTTIEDLEREFPFWESE